MKYEVWCLDSGSGPEYARVIEAHEAYAAAEAWANWADNFSADYSIVDGQEARACVREYGGTEVHEFIVTGRTERVYSARLVPANLPASEEQ